MVQVFMLLCPPLVCGVTAKRVTVGHSVSITDGFTG